jgi:hypothetical protein
MTHEQMPAGRRFWEDHADYFRTDAEFMGGRRHGYLGQLGRVAVKDMTHSPRPIGTYGAVEIAEPLPCMSRGDNA